MVKSPVSSPAPVLGPASARRRAPQRLWRLPGVYAPQADTLLLSRALRLEGVSGLDVLDVGTGSGALALHAAHLGAHVTALDISRRAIWSTRLNALRARQPVTAVRGDLETSLTGRRFDLVVSNPPYVPAPDPTPPAQGAGRAWDAGTDGRHVLDRLCDAAPALLRPHGVLLVVHSALNGTERTLTRLDQAGLCTNVVDRALVPYGPVLRGRLDWLRERGLVDTGADEEELVVIRAERV
ncbi:HemK2/MTQ2 family protein methyltransferase [Streptomyces alboflavus]|uniref:HemK2/MTQ2 family protein methyltransferase n=1 Tax=Streptomyces alboflavus TaxID=67267 RepID=UPI0036AFF114